nr:disease resistance protein At4g27190-like [Ziziphus jujuba var. spinosa]
MKSQKIFAMEVLSDDEAWNLFEEVAAISNRTRDLYDVAKKVAKECKGLPVAIVTVGRALENRDKYVWEDALHKLGKAIPDSKLKTDVEVYSRIKLSYDLLRSKEAKSCFLLCCLFPEDYDIGIETLVRYGKGLRLFRETDTMEQTRNRVHTLAGDLKRCFLLMDGNQNECVRMHDIVRDVAISIASRKKHGGFVVRCDNEMEEWPEIDSSEMEHCTAISLVFNKGIKKHPDNLACPKLKLLSLSSTTEKDPFLVKYHGHKFELSENFSGGIKEIKVLAFQCIYIQTLPASLQMLQNLRTLHLEYCALGDISIIGGLEMLEILSLIGSEIQELPMEIGNLQHLKVLDMTGCYRLERIPCGVLSRLTTLEELKIFPFSSWSSLEGNEEKTSASLDEIIPRDLKVLNVQIPKMKFVPRNFPFKNLTRFEINVGTNYTYEDDYLFGNYLRLGEVSADSIKQSGIHPIVKKCEVLQLYEVYDLKNLFPHFDEEEQDGFPWLRTLEVGFCKEMEYVVKFTSNNNRTNLHVPNIFPLLEKLELYGLEGLKGIFHYNSDDLQLPPTDHQFVRKERISTASSLPRGFPQLQRLTELTLQNLPSLISLCRAIDDEGSTRRPKDADGVESNMDNMNTPTKILVPFKCIKWLPSLANLSVDSCDSIRTLFSFLGDDHDRQLDNQKEEWLKNLEELGVHWCNSLVVIFDIRWSRKADAHMEDGSTTAKLLVMLKSLKVANCRSMEEVVAKTEEKIKNVNAELYVVSFPHLVSIELDNLDNLYCFCQQPYTFEFSSLEILQIRECPKLQKFSTANKTLKTPELTDVELDDKYIEILEQDLNDTIRHYFETSQSPLSHM